MFGTEDLLIGLALVFFLFGAKRLPELAGSLGKSMKEFKRAVEGGKTDEPEGPKPAGEIQAAALAPRVCVSCRALLGLVWQHCPRCGPAVPPPPASASS